MLNPKSKKRVLKRIALFPFRLIEVSIFAMLALHFGGPIYKNMTEFLFWHPLVAYLVIITYVVFSWQFGKLLAEIGFGIQFRKKPDFEKSI